MGHRAEVIDVSSCDSISAVLEQSGTAWEPSSLALKSVGPDGTVVQDAGFHAIIRPDTGKVLGTCTARYRPNSHVVHLAKLDNMVRGGGLKPERVSVWFEGRIMAFQFSTPVLDAEIASGDRVSPLLTLAFWNDGKHGDMSFFADFRWACTNQMGMVSKANGNSGKAHHRGNVHESYEKLLLERIDEMKNVSSVRYQNMRRMLRTSIAGKNLLAYFAVAAGVPNLDSAVDAVYENRAERPEEKAILGMLESYREDSVGAPATVWHAYNSVTRFLTHKIGRVESARSRQVMFGKQAQEVFSRAYEGAVRLAA